MPGGSGFFLFNGMAAKYLQFCFFFNVWAPRFRWAPLNAWDFKNYHK